MSDGGEAGVTQKPLQTSRESGNVQEDMRTHPSRHLSRMPDPQRSRGCTRVAGVVPCWHQQSGCWYHGARRSHVVPAQQGACWSSTVKLAPAKRSVCLCEGGLSEECDCWGGGVVLKTIDRAAALRQRFGPPIGAALFHS